MRREDSPIAGIRPIFLVVAPQFIFDAAQHTLRILTTFSGAAVEPSWRISCRVVDADPRKELMRWMMLELVE